MKWIETKVLFKAKDRELAVELISNIFFDFGVKGVVVEGHDVDPVEGWAESIRKPEKDAVAGYFSEIDSQKKCAALEERLKMLDFPCSVIYRTVDEEDWASSWKKYFHPLKIGSYIVVKPTWQQYLSQPDDILIEIDPGMAFGTGTHPTTSMCIRMIEAHAKPGMSFLDIGTGSGILMIAAAKLGLNPVFGIDTDITAIDVARKNLIQNNIHNFGLVAGNLIDTIKTKFDLIAANILTETILILLDNIQQVLNPKATLICSGIIEEKANDVILKMEQKGFVISETYTQEGWIAIAGLLTPQSLLSAD